jgi:hypothetical protein
MHLLGGRFLRAYYRVLLRDSQSVVVCTVDDSDPAEILGFASGTLDAGQSNDALRRGRFSLGFAAILAVLCRPWLLGRLISRYRSLSPSNRTGQYLVSSGPRGTYWAVLPEARKGGLAFKLLQKWLNVMRELTAQAIQFEVDKAHASMERAHICLGARVVKELVTPDGKARLIMEYPGQATDRGGRT